MNGRSPNGNSPPTVSAMSQDEDAQARAARLEREAEAIRLHLDTLLGELDRRRHAAVDLGKRIGSYVLPVAISAAVTLTAVSAIVALVRRRSRRRAQLSWRAAALSHRVIEAMDLKNMRRLLAAADPRQLW